MWATNVLLCGSQTWPVVIEDVTADNGMIRWICSVPLKDYIPTTDLLLHLGLSSINGMPCWNQLRSHGHLLCMDDDAWHKKATMYYVDGRQPRGQPHKRVYDVILVDMKLLNLSNEDTYSRAVWSRAIKPKKVDTICRHPTHPCGFWTLKTTGW